MSDMLNFDWDSEKAEINLRKHGITFEEACTTFRDPLATFARDTKHGEIRHILIGMSEFGRLLFTVHREEGDVIRIISSRRVTKREKRIYEEEQ